MIPSLPQRQVRRHSSLSTAPGASRDDLLALLDRATFGFTEAEFQRASALGYRGWLEEQLDPESIDDSGLDARLVGFPTLTMNVSLLTTLYPSVGGIDRVVSVALRHARVLRAQFSKRQLFERMVEFWSDHFSLDGEKASLRYLKTVDDREVIRAHALGNFRDLLGASAHSGAMLYYLDSIENKVGAPNENYARELLELHTLGVDGGYTETDVAEVARCFTGWNIVRVGGDDLGTFNFVASDHDFGEKLVLGTVIPLGGGTSDGETVLDLVAAHPSTAAFIAAKLCRFFLGYEPPQRTVDRVAAAFSASDGDIKATVRAVLSPRSFRHLPSPRPLKLRRPLEFCVAALRATGATVLFTDGVDERLRLMGHLPFAWPAPDGYPDALEAWGSTMLPRWAFGTDLMEGAVTGVFVPNAEVTSLLGAVPQGAAAEVLNQKLTGGRLSPVDVAQIQAFVDGLTSWTIIEMRAAMGLALSMPGFQFH